MIPSINPEEPSSSSSSSEEDSDDEYQEEDDEEQGECYEKTGTSTTKKGSPKGSGHRCPHCEKVFPFPNKLREHMKIHEVGRYACAECSSPKKFDTFNEFREHRKQFHSQAFHKCPQCPYTNSKPAFLRRHVQLNHVDGIPCTITGCFMKVAKNRMKAHIKHMHSATETIEPMLKPIRAKLCFHKCPSCDYVPDHSLLDARDQYDELMRHIRIVHDKQRQKVCSFGCNAILRAEDDGVHWKSCPKLSAEEPSTSTPRLVDDEDTNTVTSQSVATVTSYPEDCGSDTEQGTVELLSNSLIEAELEEEEGEPQKKMSRTEDGVGFYCDVCQKSFTKGELLRKHFNACHSKQKTSRLIRKKFTCERSSMKEEDAVCGKSFRTEQALHDHYNVHDGVKPYACLTCNQKFHARDRFAVHLSKYHLTSIKDLNAINSQFGVGSKEPSPEPEIF